MYSRKAQTTSPLKDLPWSLASCFMSERTSKGYRVPMDFSSDFCSFLFMHSLYADYKRMSSSSSKDQEWTQMAHVSTHLRTKSITVDYLPQHDRLDQKTEPTGKSLHVFSLDY